MFMNLIKHKIEFYSKFVVACAVHSCSQWKCRGRFEEFLCMCGDPGAALFFLLADCPSIGDR